MFTYSCLELTCSFDAEGSVDPDGMIVGYAWDFDDGESGTDDLSSHTYNSAGTYTVVLTVTDDSGATGSEAQTVPVGAEPKVIYLPYVATSGGTASPNRFATAVVTVRDKADTLVEGTRVRPLKRRR